MDASVARRARATVVVGTDATAVAAGVARRRLGGERAAGYVGEDPAAAAVMAADLFGRGADAAVVSTAAEKGGDVAGITGVSHVGLTVRDVDRSKAFYSEVLGLQPMMEGGDGDARYAILVHHDSGLVIALYTHAGGSGDEFDERRTGLDHLAFAVASRVELDDWERRFRELGVTYSSTQETPYGAVLAFRDPDNVQLEIFANPGT